MTLYQEVKLQLEKKLEFIADEVEKKLESIVDGVEKWLQSKIIDNIDCEGVDNDVVNIWVEFKVRQIMHGKSYTIKTLQDEINELRKRG